MGYGKILFLYGRQEGKHKEEAAYVSTSGTHIEKEGVLIFPPGSLFPLSPHDGLKMPASPREDTRLNVSPNV